MHEKSLHVGARWCVLKTGDSEQMNENSWEFITVYDLIKGLFKEKRQKMVGVKRRKDALDSLKSSKVHRKHLIHLILYLFWTRNKNDTGTSAEDAVSAQEFIDGIFWSPLNI